MLEEAASRSRGKAPAISGIGVQKAAGTLSPHVPIWSDPRLPKVR